MKAMYSYILAVVAPFPPHPWQHESIYYKVCFKLSTQRLGHTLQMASVLQCDLSCSCIPQLQSLKYIRRPPCIQSLKTIID